MRPPAPTAGASAPTRAAPCPCAGAVSKPTGHNTPPARAPRQLQRDPRRGHNVVHRCAAGQVADGPRESLQHRPRRLRAAKLLRQLVGDVAGIQRREDQHVRLSRLRHPLGARDRRVQRRIGLHGPGHGDAPRAQQLDRLAHPLDRGPRPAGSRGIGQERHPRLAQQRLGRRRRGRGDRRKPRRVGRDIQRAVGEDQRAPRGKAHQEEARGQVHPRRRADGHGRRLDHPPRRLGRSGNQRVGRPAGHHRRRPVKGPRRQTPRQRGLHPGPPAQDRGDMVGVGITPRSRVRGRKQRFR